MTKPDKMLAALDQLQIDYTVANHDAVFTVEEAEKFWTDIPGTHCKNLFLRNRKGNQHYLVVLEKDKRLSIKELEQKLGNERLSFASPKRLEKYLNLTPGSVTPFGIINDTENHVKVLLDSDLQNAQIVNFHPDTNTATVSLSFTDFKKFMDWSGNAYDYIEI